MNYVTGNTIRILREKKNMTQKSLADSIGVSDKAISKWETGKGLPDICIIEDLSKALGVSITELLTGELHLNENRSANIKKMQFYVCPICGNIITATGQGGYSCCGIMLPPQEPENCEDDHMLTVETVDNEYFISSTHPMGKQHYISFIAYVTSGSAEIVKLYPEQDISVRLKKKGHGFLYMYCNKHGMFKKLI